MKEDGFDRLVKWATKYKYMKWFAPIYARFKEMLLYALFGLGTVIIAIGSYCIFTETLNMNVLYANAYSWVGATLFAFFSNRKWVFTVHETGKIAFFKQLISFSTGRFFTLVIEEWMLHHYVVVLGWPNMPVKWVTQVIVIFLNYVISKLFVFSSRGGRAKKLIEIHEKNKELVAKYYKNAKIPRGGTHMRHEEAVKLLEEKGQSHILKFYNTLSVMEKDALLSQIEDLDFDMIDMVKEEKGYEMGEVSPLNAVTVKDIEKNRDEYKKAGIKAIQEGKVAALLLAGGMGTRLGSDRPKGELNVGLTRELSIFKCLMNNLMDVTNEAGVSIPLYIMTSEKNDKDTRTFFEEKDYFGYKKEDVQFFRQEMAAAVDFDGKLLLEGKGRLATSPNGNGGWFASMKKAGLIEDLHNRGVEWINIFAVDNVLQRICDPAFIGATLLSGAPSGGKVVHKAAPDEKVGVLCRENGAPSIVEYYEMPQEMIDARDAEGDYLYPFGVILNYLFRVDKLEEIVGRSLPVHIVKKKIPYIDGSGELVKPEEPNGYKFETLVVDMIRLMDDMVPYEVVREKEFAPIKNLHGVDSLDSARELLKQNGVEL